MCYVVRAIEHLGFDVAHLVSTMVNLGSGMVYLRNAIVCKRWMSHKLGQGVKFIVIIVDHI